MSKVFANLAMSLDGYIAGPHAHPGNPLGDGGSRLHEWMFRIQPWRERHGMEGGEESRSALLVAETFDRTGAYVMGRRMFDEGEAARPDPPPFRAPVYVLTTTARAPWIREGGTIFTYVTDGIEAALEQARQSAGHKDVQIAGGAHTVREYLGAGLLDELQPHLVPILLGTGTRLLEGVASTAHLEVAQVIDAPDVTHLRYTVLR